MLRNCMDNAADAALTQLGCYTAGTSPVFRANDRLIGHHPIHPPSTGFGRLTLLNGAPATMADHLQHLLLRLPNQAIASTPSEKMRDHHA
jgi:hypothetical protein